MASKEMRFPLLMITVLLGWGLSSCQTVDLYEKNVAIPEHAWSSHFKPQFKFQIHDTSSNYQLFIVVRHTEKYNYNNIWLNLYAQGPGQQPKKFSVELPLATNNGWLGRGMDDLYDDRIALTLDPSQFNFTRAGEYNFTLENVMREDPLENVMNVGLRIEKIIK